MSSMSALALLVKRCSQRCVMETHVKPQLKTFFALMTTVIQLKQHSLESEVCLVQEETVAMTKAYQSVRETDAHLHQQKVLALPKE